MGFKFEDRKILEFKKNQKSPVYSTQTLHLTSFYPLKQLLPIAFQLFYAGSNHQILRMTKTIRAVTRVKSLQLKLKKVRSIVSKQASKIMTLKALLDKKYESFAQSYIQSSDESMEPLESNASTTAHSLSLKTPQPKTFPSPTLQNAFASTVIKKPFKHLSPIKTLSDKRIKTTTMMEDVDLTSLSNIKKRLFDISEDKPISKRSLSTRLYVIVQGEGKGTMLAVPSDVAFLALSKSSTKLLSESTFTLQGDCPDIVYVVASKSLYANIWTSVLDVFADKESAVTLARKTNAELDADDKKKGKNHYRDFDKVFDYYEYKAVEVLVEKMF